MRREIPIAICFLFGVSFILEYFIPHHGVLSIFETIRMWAIIVIAFAYVLGVSNLVRINSHVIQRRGRDWPYKIVLVVSLFFMITVGIIFDMVGIPLGGIGEGTVFGWVYYHAQYPLQATMFSLLAFFIASAAYRAFRARTVDATLMLVTAIVIMFARVPIGRLLWQHIMPDSVVQWRANLPNDVSSWILNVPSMAASRSCGTGFWRPFSGTKDSCFC